MYSKVGFYTSNTFFVHQEKWHVKDFTIFFPPSETILLFWKRWNRIIYSSSSIIFFSRSFFFDSHNSWKTSINIHYHLIILSWGGEKNMDQKQLFVGSKFSKEWWQLPPDGGATTQVLSWGRAGVPNKVWQIVSGGLQRLWPPQNERVPSKHWKIEFNFALNVLLLMFLRTDSRTLHRLTSWRSNSDVKCHFIYWHNTHLLQGYLKRINPYYLPTPPPHKITIFYFIFCK